MTDDTTATDDLISAHPAVVEVDAAFADLEQRRQRAALAIGQDQARYGEAMAAHRAEVAVALEEGRRPETAEPRHSITDHDRMTLLTTFTREAQRLDVRRAEVIAEHADSIEAEVRARTAVLAETAQEHVAALAEIARKADALQRVLTATETARVTVDERHRGVRRQITVPPRVDAALVRAVENGTPFVTTPEPKRLGMQAGTLHQMAASAPEPLSPSDPHPQR